MENFKDIMKELVESDLDSDFSNLTDDYEDFEGGMFFFGIHFIIKII